MQTNDNLKQGIGDTQSDLPTASTDKITRLLPPHWAILVWFLGGVSLLLMLIFPFLLWKGTFEVVELSAAAGLITILLVTLQCIAQIAPNNDPKQYNNLVLSISATMLIVLSFSAVATGFILHRAQVKYQGQVLKDRLDRIDEKLKKDEDVTLLASQLESLTLRSPRSWRAHDLLGVAYYRMWKNEYYNRKRKGKDNRTEAIKHIAQALHEAQDAEFWIDTKASAEHCTVLANMGLYHKKTADLLTEEANPEATVHYTKAQTFLQRSRTSNPYYPHDASAIHAEAVACQMIGMPDEAKQLYAYALQIMYMKQPHERGHVYEESYQAELLSDASKFFRIEGKLPAIHVR